MNVWIDLWTGLLVLGLAIFAVLAVVVSIGGFLDIRDLFKSIEKQHGDRTGEGNHDVSEQRDA